MANEEHLAILRQGVEIWNQWRTDNFDLNPDLSNAKLVDINLSGAILSSVDLSGANLSNAQIWEADLSLAYLRSAVLHGASIINSDLRNADLRNADLGGTTLRNTDFSNADLSSTEIDKSDLRSAIFRNTNLSKATLATALIMWADFQNANLEGTTLNYCRFDNARLDYANLSDASLLEASFLGASLQNAVLQNADLQNAFLQDANLRNANLRGAKLHTSRVLYSNFTGATLTGACIEDWHIGSSTKLDDVVCDYIFRTITENGEYTGRLPIDSQSKFAPGEFTQRFQILESALETIDLTFTEGIDWQAFFQSFQELRSQNPDTDISIQGMERKAEGFIVRLEVNQEADKATIETQAKQLYAQQLQVLEAQYEERLRLQGAHLEDIRELLSYERQERTRLSKVVETMASEQQVPKYDLRGAQFAGGFAEVVKGNQYGGTINNYGQNTDDIVRLLTSLRDMAQEFPEVQREAVQVHLEDLATDLDQPEKCQPARLRTRIVGLFQVLLLLGEGVATATDFANNVLELSEKLDVPAETFQPQLEQFKQIHPEFDWR